MPSETFIPGDQIEDNSIQRIDLDVPDINTLYPSLTASRAQNSVFAGPIWAAGPATFRALVPTDIPSFSANALSSSWASASLSSSYAITASYALTGGSGVASQTTVPSASWVSASAFITTAQTSSYVTASNVIGVVNSASYAYTASYAPVQPAYSASVSTQFGTKQPNLVTGNTYLITSSWSNNSPIQLPDITDVGGEVVINDAAHGGTTLAGANVNIFSPGGFIDINTGGVGGISIDGLGNTTITNALISGSMTGNVIGTASYANKALSSSYISGSQSTIGTLDIRNNIRNSVGDTVIYNNVSGKNVILQCSSNDNQTITIDSISQNIIFDSTSGNAQFNIPIIATRINDSGDAINLVNAPGGNGIDIDNAGFINFITSTTPGILQNGQPFTASYATTASYALNGGSGGSLTTGATYPITASWSNNATTAKTASYIDAGGITTGTLNNARLPSQINVTGISASFTGSLRGSLIGSASFSTTASYALNCGTSSSGVGNIVSSGSIQSAYMNDGNFLDYTHSISTPSNGMYRLNIVATGWSTGSSYSNSNTSMYFGIKCTNEIGTYAFLNDTYIGQGSAMAGPVTPTLSYHSGSFTYYFSYLFSQLGGYNIEYYWSDNGYTLGDSSNDVQTYSNPPYYLTDAYAFTASILTKFSLEKLV